MSEEDKKLQKHLVDEMMKVSESNPDVMFYMEALMKYCIKIEQKVEQLEKENKKLNNIINELEEELDRGYRDLFDMELVPGRELILNIKNYLEELKEYEK